MATSGDVTSHSGEELILAVGDSGRDKKKYFVCVAIEEGKGKVVAKSPADIYNPWKFIIADTNLDGKLDLACGVKKEACDDSGLRSAQQFVPAEGDHVHAACEHPLRRKFNRPAPWR